MNIKIEKYVGSYIDKVILEWFYFENNPVSIIRLYVQIDSILDITCCEEDVFIKERKEPPITIIAGEYAYIPIEQDISWLCQNKIISIKYLEDLHNIKRGIIFLFENKHNFLFYNKGYQHDDMAIFDIDIDIDIESLAYKIIEVSSF